MKATEGSTTSIGRTSRPVDVRPVDLDEVPASARRDQQVTVVTISGEIDISNVSHVAAFAARSALEGDALLLDMSGVNFFAVRGISMLLEVDEACRRTGSPWALIAGAAVRRVLRLSKLPHTVPIANSSGAAMQYFAYVARGASSTRSGAT